jgi:hypothetical protein
MFWTTLLACGIVLLFAAFLFFALVILLEEFK